MVASIRPTFNASGYACILALNAFMRDPLEICITLKLNTASMSIISSIALVISRLKDILPKTEDCHGKP